MKVKKFPFGIIILSLFLSCAQQSEKKHTLVSVVNHPLWSQNKTIYQVNLRQFSTAGDFNSLGERLPELKKLGVGIIWLLPVYPIGGNNSGDTTKNFYAVKDFKAISPDLGNEDDFRDLIKAIHQQGMYIIMEWVSNQTATDNVLTASHPEYFRKDENGKFISPAGKNDLIGFDYNNPALRNYMLEAMQYWVNEFDIDGFNCTAAEKIPVDFWDQVRRKLELIKPVFMSADGEAAYLHNRAFDMTCSWQLYYALNNVAQGREKVTKIEEILRQEQRLYPPSAYRMRFTETYNENPEAGTAIERLGDAAKTAAVLTATIPGKPMIYNGQEAGLEKMSAPFKEDSIQWKESVFRNFYSKLFSLYRDNPALYQGKMVKISPDDEAAVYAFARVKENYKVVVVLNFSANQRTIELESDELPGKYTELFSNVPLTFEEDRLFDLEPWAYRVFVAE